MVLFREATAIRLLYESDRICMIRCDLKQADLHNDICNAHMSINNQGR
jgi:hypothetical protein